MRLSLVGFELDRMGTLSVDLTEVLCEESIFMPIKVLV